MMKRGRLRCMTERLRMQSKPRTPNNNNAFLCYTNSLCRYNRVQKSREERWKKFEELEK